MQVFNPLQPPIILHKELAESFFQYREYMPNSALKPYIACYWIIHFTPSTDAYLHRIIPDGCVDIIFDLEHSDTSNSAYVAGLMTSFETMHLSSKNTLFGIRFYLDNASSFFGYPISEFNGYHVLLEEIWGQEANYVVEQVRSSNGISEMIERIEFKLLKICYENDLDVNPLFKTSMQYIYASRGTISIRTLAKQICYSERNITRIFKRELGISPKELSSIIKFQNLLRELHQHHPSAYAEVAMKYGYYDQSHFIKYFKRLYGLTPNQVFK